MKSRNDTPRAAGCTHEDRPLVPAASQSRALEKAARLFRALGDAPRLRLLHLLLAGEVCVGELVAALGEKFSTVSQRLRVLRAEGLVSRRREGSHVFYSLADDHVKHLVSNALDHVAELHPRSQSDTSVAQPLGPSKRGDRNP